MSPVCPECQSTFTTMARPPRRYCSPTCANKNRGRRGAQHPKWKGGKYKQGGYIRIKVGPRKYRAEHDLIMESILGRKLVYPQDTVHHKNGRRDDNRPENLQLVDPLTHMRLHSGCELRNGVWWKPCRTCRVMKPVTDFYSRTVPRGYIHSSCKPCHSRVSNERVRLKRLQLRHGRP